MHRQSKWFQTGAGKSMRRRWWLVLGVALMGLGVAVLFADPRVTEREAVYHPTFARQVELFGGLKLTLGSETARFVDGDSVVVVPLLLGAGIGLALGLLLWGVGARVRHTAYAYLLGGLGLLVLALDELFGVHETIGHNLGFLEGMGAEHPDDVVFLIYPVAIAIYVWKFRDILLERKRQRTGFLVAAVLVALAAFSDLFIHPPERLEDLVELAAVAVGVLTLGDLVRRDLRRLGRALERAIVIGR